MSSEISRTRVALLGLGLMGAGMASSILRAGFPLTLYNRSRERADPFAARGARVASTPREAAAGADLVLAMVADDSASRGVWLGGDGALEGAARGTVCIEASTLTVEWVHALSEAAAARGLELLDAPVTGSRVQAEAGELLFLVGGTEAALERARPVLRELSRGIIHVGPSGSGALLKLVNNFLCGVQVAAFAEALALVERSGLDPRTSLDVLTEGAPGSPIVRTVAARMEHHDYAPHFLLRLMAKDLRYAAAEAGAVDLPLRTAAAALDVFESGIEAGYGEDDLSAVVEQFRSATREGRSSIGEAPEPR